MGFAPGGGNDLRDLPVGHMGQAYEHVPEVSIRINAASAAVFNDGVEDRAAVSRVGFADEEPVLFVMLSSA